MNVGLICYLGVDIHPLYKSYYNSVISIYDNVKDVKNIDDLNNLDLLIIGDEHFAHHKMIWMNDNFINKCNELNIKVVVFNNEKIINSFFKWNEDNQRNISKFKNLYQYVSDIDDVITLNKKLNRMAPSKYINSLNLNINIDNKLNKAIFFGNTKDNSYIERVKLLNDISKIIDIDIVQKNDNYKWEDYINKISQYRFVISPFGNAHFFPMRFYEILFAKSIPIQQIKNNTLSYYDVDSKFDDCIFFENVNEIKDKMNNFTLKNSYNMVWLEDNMLKLLKNDNLV